MEKESIKDIKSSDISIKTLFEHGVHFGHQTHRWNPKMSPYIYGERDGTHLINLEDTSKALSEALAFMHKVVSSNGSVLFVGTKPVAKNLISKMAEDNGAFFVTHKWLGGLLTNWKTVLISVKRLEYLENLKKDQFAGFGKKETVMMERELLKLSNHFGGIKKMNSLPQLVVVMDCHRDKLALSEAKTLNIPTIGIVDTNANPEDVLYPIYGNDDSRASISLYCNLFQKVLSSGARNIKVKDNKLMAGIKENHSANEKVKSDTKEKEGKSTKVAAAPKSKEAKEAKKDKASEQISEKEGEDSNE